MKKYEYCIEQEEINNSTIVYYIMRKSKGKNWETIKERLTKDVAIKELAKYQDAEKRRLHHNAVNMRNKKERDDVMESLGLVKVKGCISGKIYWE